ncbi:MAG: hypothetical protein P8J32_04755 [bacterium]|nr:hypothetical protein [bacterium]
MTTEAPTQTKPFFHLGNPSVEYSTDFDFFMENQVFTTSINSAYPIINFNSRLESKWFGRIKNFMLNGCGVITAAEIKAKCKEIHQQLMAGKFGEPTFVD